MHFQADIVAAGVKPAAKRSAVPLPVPISITLGASRPNRAL